jgi:hypothetical protein
VYHTVMAEGTTETTSGEGLQDRVTIKQAAALLGVHPNTVRKRVKEGVYAAEKVSTEHGFTWMVHRNNLLNTPPTKDLQPSPLQPTGNLAATPEAFMQGLLRPFVEDLGRVREELGAERVRREQAERERDDLAAELEALRETRDAPETATEDPANSTGPEEPFAQEETQDEPTSERRERGWLWRIFIGGD